jgi:putative oxidoreductase
MDYLPSTGEFDLALFLLRAVVGPTFAFHGYAKLFRGGRLAGTAGWFDSIGMRPGHVHARMAAAGELLTGTCLALGFMTPFAGMGLVGLMFVAFWTVHRGNGLLVVANGWEYNLVLATIGVTVAILGPGKWSLDNALGINLNGGAGLAISLFGGLALAGAVLASSHRPPVAAAEVAPGESDEDDEADALLAELEESADEDGLDDDPSAEAGDPSDVAESPTTDDQDEELAVRGEPTTADAAT